MRTWSEPYPLVSVVITSYNYERYLAYAIESVLNQDYPNFELLVLDNCSTDSSPEIARRYLSNARMRYIPSEKNIGLVANHNRGIEEARGEYVVFLSADDMFLPGHLTGAIEYYRKHPSVDVLYTRYCTMNGAGRMYERFHHHGIPDVRQFDNRNEFVDVLRSDNYMCFPTMLFPRALLLEMGGLSESVPVAGDYDMCLRYITAGVRFGFLDVAPIAMRWHETNRSREAYIENGQQLREHVLLLDRYLTPENLWRVRGREAELTLMLSHKIASLQQFPQVHAIVMAELQPVIDSILERLNASAALPRREPCAFPRVSVIVITRGITAYLEDALRSLQSQTFDDFEVVIVQDGGADLEPFIRHFGDPERFRYMLRNSQGGPSAARNTGFTFALGEIIAYLDEDNVFESNHLERLVSALDATDARVAYSRARVAVETVDVQGNRQIVACDDTLFDGASWPVKVANTIPLNSVAHYRSCLQTVGTFSQMPILEDWEFLHRFGTVFPNAACVDRTTVELRQRVGFADQQLRTSWNSYHSVLTALHAHYNPGADGDTAAARAAFASRVVSASPLINDPTPASTIALLRALSN